CTTDEGAGYNFWSGEPGWYFDYW
nr:immunoglobulin heavy chain junction region [Macaca mulatta]MOX38082.1 immunoglobulin heavy chain junction region [Macaca mulatta]MOX38220.1 immunoglobulin heavy chain junction region [Macaca mulatta]MOX38552.1 immunoglobulin heavy chain junction region [Macaca mulatta]MOX38715.1 immunoglobulin heavy chain junction region [Macaca mulatta]